MCRSRDSQYVITKVHEIMKILLQNPHALNVKRKKYIFFYINQFFN